MFYRSLLRSFIGPHSWFRVVRRAGEARVVSVAESPVDGALHGPGHHGSGVKYPGRMAERAYFICARRPVSMRGAERVNADWRGAAVTSPSPGGGHAVGVTW